MQDIMGPAGFEGLPEGTEGSRFSKLPDTISKFTLKGVL